MWHRQHVPGESLDLDEGMDQVLVNVEGVPALLTMGKYGILWKLDRRDGSFLGLKDSGIQNAFSEVNPETGAVRYRDDIQTAHVPATGSLCAPRRPALTTGTRAPITRTRACWSSRWARAAWRSPAERQRSKRAWVARERAGSTWSCRARTDASGSSRLST